MTTAMEEEASRQESRSIFYKDVAVFRFLIDETHPASLTDAELLQMSSETQS